LNSQPVAPPASAGPALVYPKAKTVNVVETQFGVPVADPYRWLENDVRNDPDVAAWVAAENLVTDQILKTLPLRDWFKQRMTALYNYERFGLPYKKGGRYFYTRNTGLQNQSVLYYRDGLNGEPKQLIDPNGWSADGATALAEWTPSEDGKRLAYAIQDGGTDWRTVKVMDVATGKILKDELKWLKYGGGVAWAKDGSGFYYSRYPAPPAKATYQSSTLNQRVSNGATFGRSNQARYGSSNYTNTLRTSSQSSSVASATSRGGFGSKASARSGWGGGGSSS